MLVLGLLFIYLPMLILVIYSFNASKLVTVWGGWSIKWYVGLLDNTQLMGSVLRSLVLLSILLPVLCPSWASHCHYHII